jgi:hypothetical protein
MGLFDKAKDLAEDVADKAPELIDKIPNDVKDKGAKTAEELADKLPDSIGDKIEGFIPGDPDKDGK